MNIDRGALVEELADFASRIEAAELMPFATKAEVTAVASQLLLAEQVDLLRAVIYEHVTEGHL